MKTILIKIIILLLSVIIFEICGCSDLKIALKPSTFHEGKGKLIAGTSKVEITPPPGHAMGGNSFEAKTSNGFWTRLYSRAIYMEDSLGIPLVLVSA
jgi:neutral ceramidase